MNPLMNKISIFLALLCLLFAHQAYGADKTADSPLAEPAMEDGQGAGADSTPAGSPEVKDQAETGGEVAKEEGAEAEAEAEGEPLPALVWYDGTVTRVRDTNLIEIDGEKMRLLGVAGPRRWWWGPPRDCHAVESIGYLEEALKDKEVKYAFDPAVGPDRKHGFRRVYVMEGEHLINADLLEKGHGFADRSRKYSMRERFESFETTAKLHMLGLWHRCPVECYRGGEACRVKNW